MSVARGSAGVSLEACRVAGRPSRRPTRAGLRFGWWSDRRSAARECPRQAARRSSRWQALTDWGLVLAVVGAVWWWVPVGGLP